MLFWNSLVLFYDLTDAGNFISGSSVLYFNLVLLSTVQVFLVLFCSHCLKKVKQNDTVQKVLDK